LSHRASRATLEEIQLRAMRAFVEALRKQKYASKEPAGSMTDDAGCVDDGVQACTADRSLPVDEGEATSHQTDGPGAPSNPRRRGRYMPAAVRRAVAARDRHRCTHVDASGRRCSEAQRLEFHHIVPFAVGGSNAVSNLTLRCHAHNALAAEQDFGRELMAERSSALRHDSFSKQGP
jgi:hypothetical protein